jgi:endothelin-converting enzyme
MSLSSYVSTFAPRNFPEKIVVTHPPYIASVRDILISTPDHVLSGYFVTRIALSYSKFLGPATPIRTATRKLQVTLQGLKQGVPEDRQMFCQSYADELQGLGLLGGKEFVERTFAGDSKVKAESVIHSLCLVRILLSRHVTKSRPARRHHLRFQGAFARGPLDG